MTYTLSDIETLIVELTGAKPEEVQPDTDIYMGLGCCGNDFDELIQAYAQKFGVDMTSYLWYVHTEEEGHSNSIGRAFFKTPYERVTQLPVTPALLQHFADTGKWDIDYPEHRLPKRRYDIWINQLIVILFVAFLIYTCRH